MLVKTSFKRHATFGRMAGRAKNFTSLDVMGISDKLLDLDL